MVPDVNLNLGVPLVNGKPDPKALQMKMQSMFMETMLKSMEESVDADDGLFGDSVQSDVYRGMIREQLASNLTAAAFKSFDDSNVSSNPPSPTPGLKMGMPPTKPAAAPPVAPALTATPAPNSQSSSLATPVNGVITSPVGWRRDPIDGTTRFHKGTDYAAPVGTPISAVEAGVVVESGPKGTYGNVVVIQTDDGKRMLYGHNQANLVSVGQRVQAGDEIAQVGATGRATGPHVHFEVLQ